MKSNIFNLATVGRVISLMLVFAVAFWPTVSTFADDTSDASTTPVVSAPVTDTTSTSSDSDGVQIIDPSTAIITSSVLITTPSTTITTPSTTPPGDPVDPSIATSSTATSTATVTSSVTPTSACPNAAPGYTEGDINGDGLINNTDADIMKAFFGQFVTPCTDGDLNGDGKVDATDFGILAPNIGATTTPGSTPLVFPDGTSCYKYGDILGDGVVDQRDMDIFQAYFGQLVPANTDGDFNGDGKVDASDFNIIAADFGESCSTLVPTSTPPANTLPITTVIPTTTIVSNGVGIPTAGGNGGGTGGSTGQPQGQVLGAAIGPDTGGACGIYMDGYVNPDGGNSIADVVYLQNFLDQEEDAQIFITGIYDKPTQAAVNAFQLKYNTDILKPWSDLGLLPNDNTPTGYVYKTTRQMINNIECPSLNLPIPKLP